MITQEMRAINKLTSEIWELKSRIEYLEKKDLDYGKAVAYSAGTHDVPFDAYHTNLHDHSLPFQGVANWHQQETSQEILDGMRQLAKEFKTIKENKLD